MFLPFNSIASNYFLAVILVVVKAQIGLAGSIAADLGNPDLPWDSLRGKISADATLMAASSQDYFEQCVPEFLKPDAERSFEDIQDRLPGVCTHSLVCGFEDCSPIDDSGTSFGNTLLDFLVDEEARDQALNPGNPRYNIPSSVLFPSVASDVVAAVGFAVDNNLELSVKASGHSYAGSSQKAGTLLVNTLRYKKYSPAGIVECTNTEKVVAAAKSVINPDLSNQACLLAIARDKRAYIRVGGGENWGEVYKSVKTFNEAQDAYKYTANGGAEPTVTPMGWTFQGGLGGSTGGRMYGFGVDQVLQIEAVLPNGLHVRFGPTSWEDAEGFLFPKTTKVSGVCNGNPGDEEEDWKWRPCPMEINFDDLWFAFRGGGGGTYGIVTSIYLQLHDYLPLELVLPVETLFTSAENEVPSFGSCDIPQEDFDRGIGEELFRFNVDYLFDPVSIGVSEEASNACGSPGGPTVLFCYGKDTGKMYASKWKTHILSLKPKLLDMNVTESSIDAAADCLESSGLNLEIDDYYTAVVELGINGGPPTLFAPSTPAPKISTPWLLVPLSFFREEKQMFYEHWKTFAEDNIELGYTFLFGILYAAFGTNNLAVPDDQTTSLSKAHREAAFMTHIYDIDDYVSWIVSKAYNIRSTDTEIPAHIGSNHVSTLEYGPLKRDPTKVCDTLNLTLDEATSECFSTQMAVWGSKNLARLEAIKEDIDPKYIFDCQKCVGNDRATSTRPAINGDVTIVPEIDEPISNEGNVETAESNGFSAFPLEMTSLFRLFAFMAVSLM